MSKRIVTPEEILGDAGEFILNKYISIPSSIHGYSLAVEYMRNWVLQGFPKEFFKTVNIGGSHAFIDYRRFNRQIQQQIQKPAVTINPSINAEYNREMVDLIQGGLDIYTRRSNVCDERFFLDRDNNLFIGIQFKQIEMPFTIKMRVRTKAQQLDLLEYVKLNCRIGSTQTHFIDIDCHVPYDIMLALALDVGFETVQDEDGQYHIKNIIGFLSYLNSKSLLPFMYKLRTISGRCEFFIRIPHCHTHISCLDGISIDDGERLGSTDSNFHVEFTSTLLFSVPAIYAYYSLVEHRIMNKEIGEIGAMYQIVATGPPEVNEKGWRQYIATQWIDDSYHIDDIEFAELLDNTEIQRVIRHSVELGFSPAMFMDIKIYNGQKEVGLYIDWENYRIRVHSDVREEVSDIAIYADMEYINQTLINMDNLNKDRQRISPRQ